MHRVLWGRLRQYIGPIFEARLSCWGIVICLDFGLRTPRGFSWGSCVWVSGFLRSLSPSLFFFSSSFLAAGLGVFSSSSVWPGDRTPDRHPVPVQAGQHT